MSTANRPLSTRLATLCAATAIAAVIASAGPPDGFGPATAEAACARATAPAVEVPRIALRRAVTCQVNVVRSNRGRKPVRRNARLERVAQRHTMKMVQTGCLRPRCSGQAPLRVRIRRSGYLDGARRWSFAMSTGCARTARAMVRVWRETPYHRGNLIRPRFAHIGVGTAPRATAGGCGDGMATFTVLLAWRAR